MKKKKNTYKMLLNLLEIELLALKNQDLMIVALYQLLLRVKGNLVEQRQNV